MVMQNQILNSIIKDYYGGCETCRDKKSALCSSVLSEVFSADSQHKTIGHML